MSYISKIFDKIRKIVVVLANQISDLNNIWDNFSENKGNYSNIQELKNKCKEIIKTVDVIENEEEELISITPQNNLIGLHTAAINIYNPVFESFFEFLDKLYLMVNNPEDPKLEKFFKNGKQFVKLDSIISNFGIFVVETKNYKGWISGDEFSDYWTQVIYKHKEKLYNPIKQNYGHVQALKTALKEFPNIVYFPIVVFTTRADLKVKTNTDVVYTTGMIKTIKKHQTEIISDDIRDKIYTYLNTLNITDRNLRKKHVHNINEKKNERKNKISNNICPGCGGSLIIRNSKYGSFKGCSNYPKCKFSFDIKK